MNSRPKRRHSRRKSYYQFFRRFAYEIIIAALILVGGFLLVEKTDVSAVIFGWIKSIFKFFDNLVEAFFNSLRLFFTSIETSDIVGYFLILLAIHLLLLRSRNRLIKEYSTISRCPACDNEKIKRAKRTRLHKLIGYLLFLRIKHYECNNCHKSTITFAKRG